MNVTLDASFDEAADLFEEIGRQIFPQVERSALNDAATQARTAIRQKMKAMTGVPSKALNKRMKLHRASARKPSARIFIGTMPVSVYDHLGPRALKRGGVSWKTASGRSTDPHAFIATTRYGPGVFRRVGKPRFPLEHVTVPIAREAKAASGDASRAFAGNYQRIFASKFSFRFNNAVRKRRGLKLVSL